MYDRRHKLAALMRRTFPIIEFTNIERGEQSPEIMIADQCREAFQRISQRLGIHVCTHDGPVFWIVDDVERGHAARSGADMKSSRPTAPSVLSRMSAISGRRGDRSPAISLVMVDGATPISAAKTEGLMSLALRYSASVMPLSCHVANKLSIGNLPSGGSDFLPSGE